VRPRRGRVRACLRGRLHLLVAVLRRGRGAGRGPRRLVGQRRHHRSDGLPDRRLRHDHRRRGGRVPGRLGLLVGRHRRARGRQRAAPELVEHRRRVRLPRVADRQQRPRSRRQGGRVPGRVDLLVGGHRSALAQRRGPHPLLGDGLDHQRPGLPHQ
jgi:hypothetical protein